MISGDLLASAAFIALGGAGHCLAMCGGMAAMLGQTPGAKPPRVQLLAYHGGRIATYMSLGLWAGAAGQMSGALLQTHTSHLVSRLLMVAALGLASLQLLGGGRFLRPVEKLGMPLWNMLRPLAANLLPVRSLKAAWLVGMLWGYLPCGLVYAALGLAFASGTGPTGALVMGVFGLATAPVFVLAQALAGLGARLGGRARWGNALGWLLAASCIFGAYKLSREWGPEPKSCCAHQGAGAPQAHDSP